jgi:hypothetical protein
MRLLILATLFISVTTQARLYKVDSTGATLPDSSQTWSCVYDDTSRLLWESPVNAATYQWPADVHVNQGNSGLLCGQATWRLPTVAELETLIVCPKGRSTNWVENFRCIDYQTDGIEQQVQRSYFPNLALSYWTSDVYKEMPTSAYFVNFLTGETDRDAKFNPNRAVLVSKGSLIPKTTIALPKWNAALSVLEIPQFEAGSGIKSCKVKFDFTNDTFQVLEVK